MTLTLITLKKTPPSLRGDLSKWMQEIATGVYVGNFNSKIREKIWERVKENVKEGEATISYAVRNEIGYQFDTWQTAQKVIDGDGIPLVYIPHEENRQKDEVEIPDGFSRASRFHKARKFSSMKPVAEPELSFAAMDIKNIEQRWIVISITILKYKRKGWMVTGQLQKRIMGEIQKGDWEDIQKMISTEPIVTYERKTLQEYVQRNTDAKSALTNKIYELLPYVKREKIRLDYSFESVCHAYDVNIEKSEDENRAKRVALLATKVNQFIKRLRKEKA